MRKSFSSLFLADEGAHEVTVSIKLLLLPRVSPSGAQQAHASSPCSRTQKPALWSPRLEPAMPQSRSRSSLLIWLKGAGAGGDGGEAGVGSSTPRVFKNEIARWLGG